MRLIRFLRNHWIFVLLMFVSIGIVCLPKNTTNENDIVYNTNHAFKNKICIYVEGEVSVEGKMYFYSGDTVLDLLRASQVTDYTDSSNLDLTEELEDGLTYIISISDDSKKTVSVSNKSTIPNEISNISKTEDNDTDKVNINTASESELVTLSKIGSVKAKAIIAYRSDNGDFSSIEDLKKVSGITESIYDQIKNYITC